jgi:hypothetical protein
VLLGRRHDKPSTPVDTAKFWNPTVEKIVSMAGGIGCVAQAVNVHIWLHRAR